jgi:CDP-6-deoxy-D-xylo-4-hexulose-3-dehydrase
MTNFPLASSTWGSEEYAAIDRVVRSGNFTMGEEVKKFENEFASLFGSKFALMFNSGSSANLALLSALKYRRNSTFLPGDEVIVPAVSWSTTYYPVNQIGGVLRFVDIDIKTLNIDVAEVKKSINSKTRAIFAVNLLGNPCHMEEISKIADDYGLDLIEDNCESMGARLNSKSLGTFGLGGTFSTFFSHHISTMEGGVLVTDDLELFEAAHSIRAHGWTRGLEAENSVHNKTNNPWDDLFTFVLPGYNLRPLEFEAAIGREQIKKLPQFVSVRRENASFFLDLMADVPGFLLQKEIGESSWFGFSIILIEHLSGMREELVKLLTSLGVESRPIVAGNFTRNPVMRHLDHAPLGPLPNADKVHGDGIFVGNHHYNIYEKLELLANSLRGFSMENM